MPATRREARDPNKHFASRTLSGLQGFRFVDYALGEPFQLLLLKASRLQGFRVLGSTVYRSIWGFRVLGFGVLDEGVLRA